MLLLPNISELKHSKYSKYLSLYEKLKLVRLITRFLFPKSFIHSLLLKKKEKKNK